MSLAFINDTTLTCIADSIRKKLGQDNSHTYYPSQFSAAIDSIKVVRDEVLLHDVNFYDYDGTLLSAYTKAEVMAWTSMPPVPENANGLVHEGWNYDLQTLQDVLSTRPSLSGIGPVVNVGCLVHTEDNTTTIVVDWKPSDILYLNIKPTVATGTVINWGDGTSARTVSAGNTNYIHEYQTDNERQIFNVKISSTRGTYKFPGQISSGTSTAYPYSIRNSMQELYFPQKQFLTDEAIGSYCFSNTKIKTIGCSSGLNIYASQLFFNCMTLQHITLPKTDNDNTIKQYCFYGCAGLQSVSIPEGIVSLGNYAFRNCYNLKSITLPSSLTGLSTYAFYACHNLECIIIPSGITSIPSSCFTSCIRLRNIFMGPQTPPSLANSGNISYYVHRIHVPVGCRDAYTAATNWSGFADKIVDDYIP